MNRWLHSLHTWLGIVAGWLLLVTGLAGAVLLFADDIDAWLNPIPACSPARGRPASFNGMLAGVRKACPEAVLTGIRMNSEQPDRACIITMTLHGDLWFAYVDRFSGSLIGARNADHSFVRQTLALHRSFFVRPWGEAVVAILAVIFFSSALTGIIIYRKSLLRIFSRKIRWKGSARTLARDLHVTIGTLAAIFQLMISATGFYIISPVFKKIVAGAPPRTAWAQLPVLPINTLVARASQALPGFRATMVSLPNAPGKPIRVMGIAAESDALYGRAASYVSFDEADGRIMETVDIREAGWGSRLDALVRTIHFGQYGSLPIKILYALGGLTPGTLSITGAIMWWKRRRRRSGNIAATRRQVLGSSGEVCVEGGTYRCQTDGRTVLLAAGELFPQREGDAGGTRWIRTEDDAVRR